MKNAVVLLLTVTGLALAQDKGPETVKRLDSVTWDLNTHKLVWVVQTGTKVNGEFVPASSAKYEVSPDEASMMFADEKRGLSEEEADSLHHLLDVLSLYCAESTVWWDQGEGKGEGIPTQQKTTAPSKPEGKIVKVDKPSQPAPPAPKPAAPKADPNIVAEVH